MGVRTVVIVARAEGADEHLLRKERIHSRPPVAKRSARRGQASAARCAPNVYPRRVLCKG